VTVREIRRRGRAASVAALLVLTIGGCGDDPAETRDAPTPSATATDGSEETTDPAPTETTAAPSVAPATGIELAEATSALHAPEGWKVADGLLDYASAADGPRPYDSLLLIDHKSIAGADATHDSLADSWFEVAPDGAKAERLDDVDLAGTPAYCIFYTVKGDPALHYDIGTIRNGQSIDIGLDLNKRTLEENPQLLESVLASFRWVS